MTSNPLTLSEWLTEEIRFRSWSMRELARRAGLSHSAVSLVIAGQPPTWDFCAAIAPPLEISPIEVFLIAGKLSISDLRRAIISMPKDWGGAESLQSLVSELPLEEQEALKLLVKARLNRKAT